jgi:organic radical activating enzyme
MKVNEVFESIQGEGKHAGTPALFIRLSGCTRQCPYCDTKYHEKGKDISVTDLYNMVDQTKKNAIIWTGGEPLLQFSGIEAIILMDSLNARKTHHLETNGDLLQPEHVKHFSYITISPKCLETIKEGYHWMKKHSNIDIKVVTDLETNQKLIKYASTLMPLETGNAEQDLEVKRKVWKYCVDHNVRYSARLHTQVWGFGGKGI